MNIHNYFPFRKFVLIYISFFLLSIGKTNAQEYLPTLDVNASYTFTHAENISDKTLTIYQRNNDSGIINAINYEIDLNKTEYGIGDSSKTYSTKILDNYHVDITGNYNSENLGSHIYIKSKDYSSTNYTNDYVDMSKATVWSSYAFGGAITNLMGKMGDISGQFIGNSAVTDKKQAWGGAILGRGTIKSIVANFIGNYAYSSITEASGGAVAVAQYNIDSITGDFIGNYAQGEKTSGGFGGGLYIVNQSIIKNVTSNFIANSARSESAGAYGGGLNIYRNSTIENVIGDFIGNYADGYREAYAGAIEIVGSAGNITGDFIANYAKSEEGEALAGAVEVIGSAKSIIGNYIANYAKSTNDKAYGGAIFVKGNIEELKGDFYSNYVFSEKTDALGGAIYAYNGIIGAITSNFYGNSANSIDGNAQGGAVFAIKSLDKINGDFYLNNASTEIGNALGGAIYYQDTTIDELNNLFIGNYAKSTDGNAFGGAIYTNSNISKLNGDFIENYVSSNTKDAFGGAIYISNAIINEINSSFIGNFAASKNGSAQGGAIWTNSDINFLADNKNIIFTENYTESNGIIDDNAVYVDNSDATLTFNLKNNANLIIEDNFNGQAGYNINLIGDRTSTVYLHNNLNNADVLIENIILNTQDNKTNVYNFNSLTLASSLDFVPEIDFDKEEMDRFTVNESYNIENNSKLNINSLNFLNEQKKDKVSIFFAEKGLKDNVIYNGIKKVVTPIYIYDIAYENKNDAGYFVFTRGSAANGISGYNPATLVSETSSTVGTMGTMNQTMTYAFVHADTSMNIPSSIRLSMKNQNKYAFAGLSDMQNFGRYSPLYIPSNEGASFWVKPYAIFESVPLKNGPKVSNISYGTFVGFDSNMKDLRKGWSRVYTGYMGYNGATQKYSGGFDNVQNGGLIGGTITLYKGNFFNATTLSVGSNVSDSQTMYGHDDYATLLSGVGNKTGYNFEIKDGKIIIQPNLLLSYTFINTFDYTNSAGVKIDNKPVHSLQIVPGFKIIGNLKNGWQPYLSVAMNWNPLMGEKTKANNIELPKTEIKPYVQYGVGVQKIFKDKLTAYGQAMVQNGGRNGISLTAGFRWLLGKKEEKQTKNENTTVKKVLKQLSQKEKEKNINKEYSV